MLERGEYAALVGESRQRPRALHAAAHDLDGDLFLEREVGPGRQIHHAHPAMAELFDDAVRPDAPPFGQAEGFARGGCHGLRGAVLCQRGALEERTGAGIRKEERLHFTAQIASSPQAVSSQAARSEPARSRAPAVIADTRFQRSEGRPGGVVIPAWRPGTARAAPRDRRRRRAGTPCRCDGCW